MNNGRKIRMLPREKKPALIASCTPNEAIENLQRYLNNETYLPPYVFSTGRPKRAKEKNPNPQTAKKKCSTSQPLTLRDISYNEKLIRSIALINGRVMRKYNSGEEPHPERIEVWKHSLCLADNLEKEGVLPPREGFYFEMGCFGYNCRTYDIYGIGKIALLECEPERVNEDLTGILPSKPSKLPNCVKTEIIPLNKKLARKIILSTLRV